VSAPSRKESGSNGEKGLLYNYIILGVFRTESSAGIAKKHHPDLGGPESTDTFQEIAQAYEILSDPEQRRTYDQTLSRVGLGSAALLLKTFVARTAIGRNPLVPNDVDPSFSRCFCSI